MKRIDLQSIMHLHNELRAIRYAGLSRNARLPTGCAVISARCASPAGSEPLQHRGPARIHPPPSSASAGHHNAAPRLQLRSGLPHGQPWPAKKDPRHRPDPK